MFLIDTLTNTTNNGENGLLIVLNFKININSLHGNLNKKGTLN